jgi:hypothetical protein
MALAAAIAAVAGGCAPAGTTATQSLRPPPLGPTARAIAFAEKRRSEQAFAEGRAPSGAVDLAARTSLDERRSGAQRVRPEAVPIALDQLPVVRVPPMLRIADAPAVVSTSDAELEIRLPFSSAPVQSSPGAPGRQTAVVRARTLAIAEVRVGKWIGWSGGIFGVRGGTSVACGSAPDAPIAAAASVQPARWEGVRVFRDPTRNRLEYEIADGWFDQKSCRATVVRRTRTPLHEIVPGVLYGFRDRCECGVEEVLTLVMPSARNMVSTQAEARLGELRGTFTRVRLPIGATSESMMAHLGADDLMAWSREVSAPARAQGHAPGVGVFVAVEVDGGAPGDRSAARATAFIEKGRRDTDVPDVRPRNTVASAAVGRR